MHDAGLCDTEQSIQEEGSNVTKLRQTLREHFLPHFGMRSTPAQHHYGAKESSAS